MPEAPTQPVEKPQEKPQTASPNPQPKPIVQPVDTPTGEKKSKAWIWILVVIIVLALAALWFFVLSGDDTSTDLGSDEDEQVDSQLTTEENELFEDNTIGEDDEVDLGELI